MSTGDPKPGRTAALGLSQGSPSSRPTAAAAGSPEAKKPGNVTMSVVEQYMNRHFLEKVLLLIVGDLFKSEYLPENPYLFFLDRMRTIECGSESCCSS